MNDLVERFERPDGRFSPAPLWWWSGDPIERPRLGEQLESLAEGGVQQVVVINLAPSGPLYGSDADEPAFASDAWWDDFRWMCDRAGELGVAVWFYDQIGFSGANLQARLVEADPRFAGRRIERLCTVDAGTLVVHCPPGVEPVAASAVPVDDDGRPTGLEHPVPIRNGTAEFVGAPGRHRLSLFVSAPHGFDYFDADACATLLDTVHGEFERHVGDLFGSTIVGSFQDELPTMPSWSADFLDRFTERFEYELAGHLPALWEGDDDAAARVRLDYHTLRAELAEAAFFRLLYDWHQKRGLVCGVDQQDPARAGYPADSVEIYADYLRTHRWYGVPGSDHHGDAKIHSSLAHAYGHEQTWLEAFHSTGWGGTLEETFDWLIPWLRSGATLYNPHAVYYSTRGGWWEWAPPSTCWRQPYWRHYRHFADAVRRLCSVLAAGSHVCDVAVLFPTTTVQAGQTLQGPLPPAKAAHDTYLELVGRTRWFDPAEGVLDAASRDFDVIDDASVHRARVEGGRLVSGNESYGIVVLPACAVLDDATAGILDEFVRAGGLLITVGAVPETGGAAVDALREHVLAGRARSVPAPSDLASVLAERTATVEASVPTLMRRHEGATVVFVPATPSRATRVRQLGHSVLEWFRMAYTFDPDDYAPQTTVTVHGVTGDPQLWEPVSGRRSVLPSRPVPDGVQVDVPFSDGPAGLLVWGVPEPADRLPAAASVGAADARELNDDWDVRIEPTMDNRWGDFTLPATPDVPVQCWEFDHQAEDGGERTAAHATFGPHGLRAGPDPEAELPPPGAANGEVWQNVTYSLSRGIRKDRLHEAVIGPKGHVPEEYLDFGEVPAGQAIAYRAHLNLESAVSTYLAVGAPARKRAWLDGVEVAVGGGGYLEFGRVDLPAGRSVLDVRLIAEPEPLGTGEDAPPVAMRGHVAFVDTPADYERPEWLEPDRPVPHRAQVTFTRSVELTADPGTATINLASPSPCRLVVNGIGVGRQGGFDPYFETQGVTRLATYQVAAVLRGGRNDVVVEFDAHAGRPRFVLDAVVDDDAGRTVVLSDQKWSAAVDGEPVGVRLRREQWLDPAAAHVWLRPHPLFESEWLEGDRGHPGTVLPIVTAADPEPADAEWFEFVAPPGTTRMRLDVHGTVTVLVDGEPSETRPGTHGRVEVVMPPGGGTARPCRLRVGPSWGRSGGAAFAGPVEFDCGAGRMPAGPWDEYGLAAFSGAVRYRRDVHIETTGAAVLDLGRVRGTAEVAVNGATAGARFLSPYRFDVGHLLHPGANTLEVVVTNTLAPYLDAVSPTHLVLPGQTRSGLFGPVRLLLPT